MKESVFGPVPSRRLGFSLGVDMTLRKYCSFDCIYCQVGETTDRVTERQAFIDPDAVVEEVVQKAARAPHVDVITLSGSGEPTLNVHLGWILAELKKRMTVPLAVITNGSLLFRGEVRRDLNNADIVLPSLDAGDDATFQRINRPHPSLSFSQVIEGLKTFSREYRGAIWLEIMLIKNINDSLQQAEMVKDILSSIRVDKVQLNTIARPPADKESREVGSLELATIAQLIGKNCEVVTAFEKRVGTCSHHKWKESIMDILRRRSLSLDDIVRATGVSVLQAKRRLNSLVRENKITVVELNGQLFYLPKDRN